MHDGGSTFDDTGAECDSLEAVRKAAQQLLPDIAREEIPKDGDRQTFTVLVSDERRLGQRHRYTYTVSAPLDGDPQLTGATRLYKHDVERGERRVHEFGAGRLPGEFVFVPAALDAVEDEGWLIGLVIDTANEATDFAVLDARAFEAAPIATVRLPHRIPPGFHGNWFPTR